MLRKPILPRRERTTVISFANLPYRACVGIMLINKQGLVFIGRRLNLSQKEHISDQYAWQMPQGGIDRGESAIEAAWRELKEETSVENATLLSESPCWYQYDLPQNPNGKPFKGRYRGQTQKWFAFRFEGEDAEINIDEPVAGVRAEFAQWRWEKMAHLPEIVIPFKREVYEEVVEVFKPFSNPIKV